MTLETELPPQEPAAPAQPANKKNPDKKPVIVYIMILFIAAFLLMAVSFLAHQRSNAQVLGELQNSVSAMQAVQASQDEIVALQKQLDTAEKAQEALQKQLAEQDAAMGESLLHLDAMLGLYTLQQSWSAGDIDLCLTTLQDMEDRALVDLLPNTAAGVTAPAQRYAQLKDAILNRK